MESLRVLAVNPAGNKTVFVLDSISRNNYASIGAKILSHQSIDAEQVGFIKPPINGGVGRLEMCGMEFCGNASRSFALHLAKKMGILGESKISIETSGVDTLLEVKVNTLTSYTQIDMPLPLKIETFLVDNIEFPVVFFNGIIHGVVMNYKADIDIFNKIKNHLAKCYDPPAIGVMFYNTSDEFITPIVWVKEVNSTFYEGSCGSGSAAVAAILSQSNDSFKNYSFNQPEGRLDIGISRNSIGIKQISLMGDVELGEEFVIEI